MKTLCSKTGMELLSANGFSRWAQASQHPIFNISLEELLTLAATEWSPKLPELDKRLLMLAIANNCELITFSTREEEKSFAMPSFSVIESSIANLINIAGWIDAERYANRNLHYPTFNLTTATCYMQTFPDMLHRVIETRGMSVAAEHREHRLKVLENAASALSAKCRIGARGKESSLLRVTAEWAMEVTKNELKAERVAMEIREDWKQMLQTSPIKLKATNFSITDVKELRDFMLEYLPHGSIIAHDVIAHLNRLIECNVISDVDHGDILAAKIVVAANLNFNLETDRKKPLRAAFPDLLSFAKATANWQLKKLEADRLSEDALKAATLEARARIAGREIKGIDEEEI